MTQPTPLLSEGEVTQEDRDAAGEAFDIAFRGETDGIDEAMASIFAHHRITATKEAQARAARLLRDLTDHQYMIAAISRMLGPKAKQVLAMWRAQGVQRICAVWGPGAADLSGEEAAQYHLEFDAAPKVRLENMDDHPANAALSGSAEG